MAANFTVGAQVGRFTLDTEIGHGSTGVVFRALDPASQHPVALKVLAQHLALDESARARFEREAAAVAKLSHPNIAKIHEFAALPDCLYLATEWVQGSTLATLLKDHKAIPLERALRLFDQLASALDYAHSQGIIHYDIKPANIMVTPDDHAVIVDFELAWLSDAPASTNAGVLFGTPRYMAPEQIRGEAVDGQADQYSLAAVLFEMLTGQPPFSGESTPNLLYHHLYTPPPPITEINPGLPVSVEAALLRALAKRPLNRFASATEFGHALRSPTPLPYPASPKEPDAPPVSAAGRRSWLPAALPAWLWWTIAGTAILWLLVFFAFRAYRLTILPVPTVMPTVAPSRGSVAAASGTGTFLPPGISPSGVANGLPAPSATPVRSGSQNNPQMLTPDDSGLDTGLAVTSRTPSPVKTGFSGVTLATPLPSQTAVATIAGASVSPSQPTTTPTVRSGTATVGASPATSTPSLTVPPTASWTVTSRSTTAPSATRTSTNTPVPTFTPSATATLAPSPSATPAPAPPTADGWWAGAGGDAAYSGFVPGGLPLLGSTRWQVSAQNSRGHGLVAGKGYVVYNPDATSILALQWATGASAWSRSLSAELAGPLILSTSSSGQNLVVAPTTEGLVALNLDTGASAWSTPSSGLLSAKLGGVTTGSDGILYALTRTGWLYALTPSDGSLLWARQLPGSQEYGLPPTLVQTTLLAASQGNVARAFSLGSLSTLWSRTVADELVTPPCASESLGLAYVGTEHGAVYALRLSTGVLAWSIQTSSQVAGLARDDRHVYVTSTDGAVSAWDGATGGPVWAVTTGDRISAPPLTDGNGVLVTTQGGKVLFFAAATGQEMESRRMIFADAFSQGAAPAGGWLFLRGSNLYGVGP